MTQEQIIQKSLEKYPINNVRNSLGYMYDENRDKREGYIQALTEMESMVKLHGWVARDECGLWLYREKPYKVEGAFCSHWTDKNGPNSEIPLDINIFPDLTWESDPVHVEILINII